MRYPLKFGAIAVTIAFIAGCGPKPPGCDNETVANIIGDDVKSQIRQVLIDNARPMVGGPKVDETEIQSILSEFKPKLISTRTTKVDAAINKSYCAGKIAFDVSKDALSRATKGMDHNNLDSSMNLLLMGVWTHSPNGDFDAYGAKAGIKTGEREYAQDIEYTAQPTDNGDQMYVEFSKSPTVTSFLAQLSSAAINGNRPPRLVQPVPVANSTDPDKCVEGKVAEFRRSQGEEAPVMNDMLEEWEQDCANGR